MTFSPPLRTTPCGALRRPWQSRNARVLLGGAFVLAGALAVTALIEPRRLRVVRHDVRIPDLPTALEGFSIAHLSDLHVGMRGMPSSLLQRAVAAAVDARPDVAVVTGDFVDGGRWHPGLEQLRELTAVVPTFGVFGNHDAYAGSPERETLARGLEALGVHVLQNSAHLLAREDHGDERLALLGVDDPHQGKPDLRLALDGIAGEIGLRVLLAHSPEILLDSAIDEVDLVLIGHTHGGQVRLSPWQHHTTLDVGLSLSTKGVPVVRGTKIHREVAVVVSNGVGVSGLPIRLFARPEVGVLSLHRAAGDGRHIRTHYRRAHSAS